MYCIHKITLNPTVDFAAEELKKYLRMMMPRCGEVAIDYDAKAEGGFRLGLMQDFGLDISDAEKPDLDDIVYVEADEKGGIITGDHILYILGRYMKKKGQLDNNTVVTTIMSNFGLYKAFDEAGIDYAKTKVGDKYVYEYMAQNGYTPQIKVLGIPDSFIEHGTPEQLYRICGMDAESVLNAILEFKEL